MTRIKVNNHYIGLDSNNQMIYPGTYEAGNPLLYGRERDLVEIGYAEWIDPPAPEEPEEPKLSDLTVPKLKEKATELGLQFATDIKKPDLIVLIEEALKKEAGGDST